MGVIQEIRWISVPVCLRCIIMTHALTQKRGRTHLRGFLVSLLWRLGVLVNSVVFLVYRFLVVKKHMLCKCRANTRKPWPGDMFHIN